MDHRHIGQSDLRVSVIGLGCNNFGMRINAGAAKAVVHRALDLGITFFDTADIYQQGESETMLGSALGQRRKDVVIATKFGQRMGDDSRQGASRRWIMRAIEGSLRRLGTDWIDLYQLHAPDPDAPVEETLRALDDLVRDGKVRAVGCSNLSASQIKEAQEAAKSRGVHGFVCSQDEYSLLVRKIEQELLPTLLSFRMGLIPYFPLAGGLLTGKYQRNAEPAVGSRFAAWRFMADAYLTNENLAKVECLQKFAAKHGHTLLDLAFAWLLAQPSILSVIAAGRRLRIRSGRMS